MKSLPRGQVTRASSASPSSSATRRERSVISGKSHAISRASMSSVTPGSVAPRAPASLAALRALRVRERAARRGDEHPRGRERRGDGGRRLLAVDLARLHHAQHRLGAQPRRGGAQGLAEAGGGAVDHDDDVLAGADAEARSDDGLHRPLKVAHARGH